MIKFENPVNGRYYYMVVEKDMFNEMVLRVTRGGSSVRVSISIACSDEQSISNEIERLSKKRIKRGYILVQ